MKTLHIVIVVLVSTLLICDGALWGAKRDKDDGESGKILKQLEKLEGAACKVFSLIKTATPLFRGAAAVALLVHGPKMQNTMLIVQSLRVSGLPAIERAISTLSEAYKRSRNKLVEEMPALLAAKAEAVNLSAKLSAIKVNLEGLHARLKNESQNLESSFKSGAIKSKASLEDEKKKLLATFEKEKSNLNAQLDDLRNSRQKMDAAGGAIKAILSSAEPDHLKGIVVSSYAAILSTAAVAQSKTAQKISMGINFGQTAYDRLISVALPQHLIQKVGGAGATWLATALRSASSALGVLLATVLNRAAVTLSAVSLGGEILIDEITVAFDVFAARFGLPAPSKHACWPAIVTGAQGALVAAAAVGHLQGGLFGAATAKMAVAGKLPFDPFIALEGLITETLFKSK